jgi:hypothetical protein
MSSNKRNAALEALGVRPKVQPVVLPLPITEEETSPAKPPKTVAKVMVYVHPKVARKFKEMAFIEDRKANDVYLDALDSYLIQQGHGGLKSVIDR